MNLFDRTNICTAFRPAWLLGAVFLLTLHAGREARAQLEQHPKGYICYRAQAPIVIDGRMDDPSWAAAPWTDDFVDIEGDKQPHPRFRTRVKMLWDDDYFYFFADLEEPHLQASFTEHDSYIFHQDNNFEIFIDPNGSNHVYGEFEINALNTGWDLLLVRPYKDGGPALDSWDIPGLKTAVHLDGTLNDPSDIDRGWSVEIAIPWKPLAELAGRRTSPRDGDRWRVNFSRVEWEFDMVDGQYYKPPERREDNWVWSPQGVVNMHRPETWGYVQFSAATGGDLAFQPDPTWPARVLLHRVYYAQKEYRRQHQAWANTLDQLGLADSEWHDPILARALTMETTANLFEARVPVRLPDGEVRRLHIRQDALIWED